MARKPAPKTAPLHRVAFARRLEAARISSGFATMRDFADALGAPEARYGRWERAEVEPDLQMLARIAKLTGVSLDILIAGERRNAA